MPEETAVEESPVKVAKPPSQIGKMLLVVVLALVSSAGGGVLSWFLLSKTVARAESTVTGKESEVRKKEDKIAEMIEKGAVIPLEPFVVNLADTDAARYLRIKISLMVDDKKKLKEATENQALQLKVRDVILQTLTGKTAADLINEEGKNRLRQDIQAKVTPYFKEPKLVDVMFTEFVIQL